jgi:nucleoside 2-deoxyribosyltransferase
VYDPQSVLNPEHFGVNGSKAQRLAVIANFAEARKLTATSDIDSAGMKLLKDSGAEVVVIKRGSFGAAVFSNSSRIDVPAFRTKSVWPIGSGDVFVACFAEKWFEGSSAADAATHASLCTASYCETRSLPVEEYVEPIAIDADESVRQNSYIYLAGPFFSIAERWLVNQVRESLLGQHLNVFSPFHDVGHGSASKVVSADIDALEKSTCMLALLDGLDTGTSFEIGYAVKRGIPVVVLVESEREEDMKMLMGTGCSLTSDLATAVYLTSWNAITK